MNPEGHSSPHNNPESPFSEPQSPGLPHLHRHQPMTEHRDGLMQADGIRRRHQGGNETPAAVASSSSSSTMRVHIQTPFSDLGASRRKEVVVDRALSVGDLKDGLSSGRFSDQGWIREGMRLVWRGRIVQDGETLGGIVSAVSQPHPSLSNNTDGPGGRRCPYIPSRG
jgi:hypothetical protein